MLQAGIAQVGLVVLLGGLVAATYLHGDGPASVLTGPGFVDGWFHKDSAWYYSIATDGYFYIPGRQSSIAFFPAYPMAIRAVGPIFGGDDRLAGYAVAVAAGLAVALLFARWAAARLPRRAAALAVALLLLYPYAYYFYGPLYGDGLYIAAAIGAFVLLDKGHPWLAALVGAAATAGRPVGLAVTFGLAVRALELRAMRSATGPVRLRDLVAAVRRARVSDYAVLLSIVGLVGWCIYLQCSFGDALAWIHVEKAPGWYQGVGPRTWFKVAFFGTLIHGPLVNVYLLVPQAFVSLLAVLLVWRVRTAFGWGYLAYTIGVLAIALLGTKDFMGNGRYVLASFPVFAAGASVLTGPRASRIRWLIPAVLVLSAAGLVVATYYYARGYEVS
jgi:hypothetical protein